MGSLSIWHFLVIFVLVALAVFVVPGIFKKRPPRPVAASAPGVQPSPTKAPIFEGGFFAWALKLALSAVITGVVGIAIQSVRHS